MASEAVVIPGAIVAFLLVGHGAGDSVGVMACLVVSCREVAWARLHQGLLTCQEMAAVFGTDVVRAL